MHYYDDADILHGDTVIQYYDPNEIREIISKWISTVTFYIFTERVMNDAQYFPMIASLCVYLIIIIIVIII